MTVPDTATAEQRIGGFLSKYTPAIDRPAVAALVAQATRAQATAFAAASPLRTVVKTVVATQRPRRPPERAPAP